MAANEIKPPFEFFTDIDGEALEAGYVYIGAENLDPEANPIQVYWDRALTITADQPLRTIAGHVVNNGAPAQFYVDADAYSFISRNKNGTLVRQLLSVREAIPASSVTGVLGASKLDPFASEAEMRATDSSALNDGDYLFESGFPYPWEVKTGVVTNNSWRRVFDDDPNRYCESTDPHYDVRVMRAAGIQYGLSQINITAATTITGEVDMILDFGGAIFYDNGLEDSDSDMTGTLRRYLGLTFVSCINVTIRNVILQSNTNKGGNGVILNSVNYSNHLRFFQCTSVRLENVVLDYRNDHPDSAYRSEGTFVDDIMRSFPIYFDNSNNVEMIDCGVANTNDTGEIIGFRLCDGVDFIRPYTMKGSAAPSNHSSLAKIIQSANIRVKGVKAYTSYGGSLIDVSGDNITISDFRSDMPNGGIVDITREWGPAGGDIEMVTLENIATSGKNLSSTAPASSVLENNTGITYNTNVNKIKRIRMINCECADDIHPFSDKRSGVNHAINSKDVQQVELVGYERRIKNPEDICAEILNNSPTTGDTSLDYDHTVKGYEFYQDEVAQNWFARVDVCGTSRLIDVKFNFSPTVATTNKSILYMRDVQIINAEAGVTPSNTKSKIYCENCEFTNVTLIIQANVEFKNCTFTNCIILDENVAAFVTFDKACRAVLSDSSSSLVGTNSAPTKATFVFFESIQEWSWQGTVTGAYVKPAGIGVLGAITSTGQRQNFDGARFNVEARATSGGAAVEDYCIAHWDRGDNATYCKDVTVDPSKTLMQVVRAQQSGVVASPGSRLDVIGCDCRGNLLRDTGGPFTNSTLMMVNNTCNATNQTGTWTTTVLAPNTTGLS